MAGKNKQQNKSRIDVFENEERIKLIEKVRERPIIWDLTDKKHFDATYIKSAWESIAEALNKPEPSVFIWYFLCSPCAVIVATTGTLLACSAALSIAAIAVIEPAVMDPAARVQLQRPVAVAVLAAT
ncbi:hypothetical protein ACLKA6_003261 [Drosophila palustris]